MGDGDHIGSFEISPELDDALERAAAWIAGAKYVVALTGAGLSVERARQADKDGSTRAAAGRERALHSRTFAFEEEMHRLASKAARLRLNSSRGAPTARLSARRPPAVAVRARDEAERLTQAQVVYGGGVAPVTSNASVVARRVLDIPAW